MLTASATPVVEQVADFPVVVVVGPEFVTGSTRMKAGTAQKLVLNMISTTCMIRMGRVKGNKYDTRANYAPVTLIGMALSLSRAQDGGHDADQHQADCTWSAYADGRAGPLGGRGTGAVRPLRERAQGDGCVPRAHHHSVVVVVVVAVAIELVKYSTTSGWIDRTTIVA